MLLLNCNLYRLEKDDIFWSSAWKCGFQKKTASANNDPEILFDFFSFDIKLCRAILSVFRHLVSGFHSNSEMGNIASEDEQWNHLGRVLAGLNLPNGPVYANFTEELFHTDQFQVLINLQTLRIIRIHILIFKSFQNFASFMITRWEELVTDWVSAMP